MQNELYINQTLEINAPLQLYLLDPQCSPLFEEILSIIIKKWNMHGLRPREFIDCFADAYRSSKMKESKENLVRLSDI